jgi:hypothetical protein
VRSNGRHVYADDELGRLAGVVVARVRPNRSDRQSIEDCWQTAYAAGLQAVRAAARTQRHTSSHFLFLAMQSAVYRLLHHRGRKEIREADVVDVGAARLCA